MGLFDDLYGPYHQVVSQPVAKPTTATPQSATPTTDPFAALMSAMLAPRSTTPAFNFPALLTALRNDPVGDYNRSSSLPSYAAGSTSPFNTGYFKNGAERIAVEQDRGPVGSYYNAPTRTATDYAEDTPKSPFAASFFGHPFGVLPHVGPAVVAPKPAPGPLAGLFARLGRDSKKFYANDPRYAR